MAADARQMRPCIRRIRLSQRRTVSLLRAERSEVESMGGSVEVGLAGWLPPLPGSGMLLNRRGEGPLESEPTDLEVRRDGRAPTALGEPRAPPKAECTSCSGGGRRACCCCSSHAERTSTVVAAELAPLWIDVRGSLLPNDCSAPLLLYVELPRRRCDAGGAM